MKNTEDLRVLVAGVAMAVVTNALIDSLATFFKLKIGWGHSWARQTLCIIERYAPTWHPLNLD